MTEPTESDKRPRIERLREHARQCGYDWARDAWTLIGVLAGVKPAAGWTDEFKDGFETGVADCSMAIASATRAQIARDGV